MTKQEEVLNAITDNARPGAYMVCEHAGRRICVATERSVIVVGDADGDDELRGCAISDGGERELLDVNKESMLRQLACMESFSWTELGQVPACSEAAFIGTSGDGVFCLVDGGTSTAMGSGDDGGEKREIRLRDGTLSFMGESKASIAISCSGVGAVRFSLDECSVYMLPVPNKAGNDDKTDSADERDDDAKSKPETKSNIDNVMNRSVRSAKTNVVASGDEEPGMPFDLEEKKSSKELLKELGVVIRELKAALKGEQKEYVDKIREKTDVDAAMKVIAKHEATIAKQADKIAELNDKLSAYGKIQKAINDLLK